MFVYFDVFAIFSFSRPHDKSWIKYDARVIYLQSKVLQRRRNKKRRKSGIYCESSAFDRPSRSSRKRRCVSFSFTAITLCYEIETTRKVKKMLDFFLYFIRLSGSTTTSKSRRLTITTEGLINPGRDWLLRTKQLLERSWTSLRVRRWPFMKTADTSPGTLFFHVFMIEI